MGATFSDSCAAAGLGPSCGVGDKAEGDKFNCLTHERWRSLAALNRCIANAKMDNTIGFVFYTNLDPTGYGFITDKGYNNSDGGLQGVKTLTSSVVNCFRTATANFGDCYCSELKCTSCVDGPTKKPKPPEVDPETPPGTGPDAGPVISRSSNITNSAYLLPIPVVYGAHIVAGNIVWCSPVRQDFVYKITEKTPDAGGKATPDYNYDPSTTYLKTAAQSAVIKAAEVPIATVDFAIALCAGPIDGIGRIWLGDKLVYDNRVGLTNGKPTATDGTPLTAVIQDPTTFGNTTADPSKTTTEIILYKGGEDQIPHPEMGTGIGAVGMRGIAYLFVRNFNLTSYSGIPQFRVEIAHDVSNIAPFNEAQLPDPFGGVAPYLAGINPAFMVATPNNGTLVLSANGSSGNQFRKGFREVDIDSLEERNQCDPENNLALQVDFDFDTAFPVTTEPGFVCVQAGTPGAALRPTYVIDVVKNTVVSTLDIVDVARVGGTASNVTQAYHDVSFRIADLFTFVRQDKVMFYWMEKGGAALTLAGSADNPFVGTPTHTFSLNKTYNASSGRPTLKTHLYYLTQSLEGVRVYYNVLRSAPAIKGFVPAAPTLLTTLNASLWGGIEGTIKGVIPLTISSRVLILIETANEKRIVCLDPFLNTVVYNVVVPSLPFSGASMSEYNGLVWNYVGSDNVAYSLSLATGGYAILDNSGAPTPVGPQFFNAADGSITYVSDTATAKVTKLYLGRTIVKKQDLGSILTDICVRAGLETTDVDFSGVSDITTAGYLLNQDVTVRNVVDQFSIYYPVTISEIGGVLTATKRGTNLYTIGDDSFAAGEDGKPAIAVTIIDKFTQVEYITVAYHRVDQGYQVSRQTLKKPAFLGSTFDLPDTQNRSYEYPFVMTDAQAKAICERVVYEAALEPNTAIVTVGIRDIRLTPGTFVSAKRGDVGFTGIVTAIDEEPGFRQRLTVTQAEATIYNEDASVAVEDDDTGLDSDDHLPVSRLRTPIVFPVPLPDGGDYFYTPTHQTPILVAPRPTGQPFDEIRAYIDINGSNVKFATYTKEVALGSLRSIPKFGSSIFTTDTTSLLTIRFDSTASVAELATATKDQILNSMTRNMLIVGKELIQFMDFTVAPDGKTVTFSNLLRGLRGTDYAMDTHTLGELCAIYDPEAMQVYALDLYNYQAAELHFGFVQDDDTTRSLTYTQVPITYYGTAAPAPVSVSRLRAYFGQAVFNFKVRANFPMDLLADGYIQNFDVETANIPLEANIYILREAFDEDKFKAFLRGELPSYVITQYPSVSKPFIPTGISILGDAERALVAAGIDAVNDELYIVLQCTNPEFNFTSAGISVPADLERTRGFFEGYYFPKGEPRAIPANLGKV